MYCTYITIIYHKIFFFKKKPPPSKEGWKKGREGVGVGSNPIWKKFIFLSTFLRVEMEMRIFFFFFFLVIIKDKYLLFLTWFFVCSDLVLPPQSIS